MKNRLPTMLRNITSYIAIIACSFFLLGNPSYAGTNGISPAIEHPNSLVAIASGIVDKGDRITFSKDDLNTDDNVVSIEWQQDFKQRKADYVLVNPKIDNTNIVFPLFVQKSMAKNLLSQCEGTGNECSVVISDDYQYGQNNEKTFRFLVYHNKYNRPYQHRFVNTNTASKIASWTKAKAESNDLATLDKAVSSAQAIFGDYLRDFSASA